MSDGRFAGQRVRAQIDADLYQRFQEFFENGGLPDDGNAIETGEPVLIIDLGDD